MGSLAPELTLFSRFSADVADRVFETIAPEARKGYVQGLTEEMRKIVAFRRDLPITNEIMEQVVMMLNTKLDLCEKTVTEPVLEEFIPMKSSGSEEEMMETDEKSEETKKKKENEIVTSTDKRELASFLQLGNSSNNQNQCPNTPLKSNINRLELKLENIEKKKLVEEIKWPVSKPRLGERVPARMAFMGFRGPSSIPVIKAREDEIELPKLPGLTLCTPEVKKILMEDGVCTAFNSKASSSLSGSSSGINVQSPSLVLPNSQSHSARKQRRCWSPELHRRFVNALQQLGGAQVATPKQIRELMQVDGLTNDEVKSHLQKYRLHSRKSTVKKGYSGPLDLWPSTESGETSKPTTSQSGSPTGPLDSRDEYDEKNESNWKNQIHLCG